MAFDFKKSLIKVQGGRQYLPVSARIVWFREEHPDWGIETDPIAIDTEKQYAIFRARIYNAEGKLMAMGTKMETVKGFPDYMEKAETGSVGRALALCGFGTQFSPELDEASQGRFADSPQGGRGGYQSGGGGGYQNNGGNRYGNGGGNSNNGPRDSPPPRELPAPRPQPAAEMPAARPAPPPVSAADDDDEFEALLAGSPAVTEDDPFGEEDVAPAPPKPAETRPRSMAPAPTNAASADGPPICVGCGRGLTSAQQALSIRKYGEALCPTCQSSRKPAGAAR